MVPVQREGREERGRATLREREGRGRGNHVWEHGGLVKQPFFPGLHLHIISFPSLISEPSPSLNTYNHAIRHRLVHQTIEAGSAMSHVSMFVGRERRVREGRVREGRVREGRVREGRVREGKLAKRDLGVCWVSW